MLSPDATQSNAPLLWPRPLRSRSGSPYRLNGILVYYDFDWSTVLGNHKAQFQNGRRLALLVQGDCPKNKTPVILLTDLTTEEEGLRETETHFIVVVNVHNYCKAGADPATTYFASKSSSPITALSRQQLAGVESVDFEWLLNQRLDVPQLLRWAHDNEERVKKLAEVLSNLPSTDPGQLLEPLSAPLSVQTLAKSLSVLDNLDSELVDSLSVLLARETNSEKRTKLLQALSSTDSGRRDAARVVGMQISKRIADTRFAAETYHAVLKNPHSTESDFQSILEDHPWLVGLDYTEVIPRPQIPRGEVDLLLRRYDGFYDLIELKSPQDPIIVGSREKQQVPPSPSSLALSPALAQALAQAHAYRETFTSHETIMQSHYGLGWTRNPRLIIVIGRASSIESGARRVLEQLNLSLHRVEIVPYDVVTDRAEMFIANVERYLVVEAAE